MCQTKYTALHFPNSHLVSFKEKAPYLPYMCLRLIPNGFSALHVPYIVQTRRSQCRARQRRTPKAQFRLTLHSEVPTRTSPRSLLFQQPSDRDCQADITQPCWHADPSVTSSGHLGSPSLDLGVRGGGALTSSQVVQCHWAAFLSVRKSSSLSSVRLLITSLLIKHKK